MKYYKFVSWDVADLEKVKTGKIPVAMQEWDNGNKKPLKELYSNGQIDVQNPVYKCGGWCFSLKEYCRRYWVKTRYYGIIECYSPNKTGIYANLGRYQVLQIVEV